MPRDPAVYYEIALDQEQIDLIKSALSKYDPMTLNQEVHDELDILKSLFGDLKDDESNYCEQGPVDIGKRVHIIHGFCF